MKALSDRHIKTPLNCEIEHSVKIDLTFTAYRSLPRAVPKFLDNCFIIGFTYFPVAIPCKSLKQTLWKIIYWLVSDCFLWNWSVGEIGYHHFYFLSYYLKLLVGMPFRLPCFISSVSLVVLTFIPLLFNPYNPILSLSFS